MMKDDVLKTLIGEEELKERVRELGEQITRDYQGKNLLLVSVLKGSIAFMADLMRAIDLPLSVDFMAVSSYGAGVKTSGVVKIIKDLDIDLKGYDLLIVEDILDSGMTLSYIMAVSYTHLDVYKRQSAPRPPGIWSRSRAPPGRGA